MIIFGCCLNMLIPFQAADGQHLILHPLNMKCLLYNYGRYDMLPHRFGQNSYSFNVLIGVLEV